MTAEQILCSASSYTEKFYFNPKYNNLPKKIQDEIQVAMVIFTEDIGGELYLFFDDEGNLNIATDYDEADYYYDEIGSGLKVAQMQREKRELFEQLEEYYKTFFMGQLIIYIEIQNRYYKIKI